MKFLKKSSSWRDRRTEKKLEDWSDASQDKGQDGVESFRAK